MVDSKELKYEKITKIKEEDGIWSDSRTAKGEKVKISKLPHCLKGTSLFKLPMRDIEQGTIFTITALPHSTVYIVQEKNGGWEQETFSAPIWTKENCTDQPFQLKKPPTYYELPKEFIVFSRQTESIGHTTKLPEVARGHKHIAIFLKEGIKYSLLIVLKHF